MWLYARSNIPPILTAKIMFNLSEYRTNKKQLTDYLPWAALIADGVVVNKDGSFTRGAQFHAPDLDASGVEELVSHRARLNNFLTRFDTGWCLQVEARRRPSTDYPECTFPDPLSQMVEDRRRARFRGEGHHYETDHYLTLTWMPPAQNTKKAGTILYTKDENNTGVADYSEEFDRFIEKTNQLFQLVQSSFNRVKILNGEELLTYLHSTISNKLQRIAVPHTPAYLDAFLADTSLLGGMQPKLGEAFLKIISIRGYPPTTEPDYLRALNDLPFEFRWTNRWLALSTADAKALLVKKQRQWFAKRMNIRSLLGEQFLGQGSGLQDTSSLNKTAQVDYALQELGAGESAFGYHTSVIVLSHTNRKTLEEQASEITRILDSHGYVSKAEDLNAVDAWFGSLPGHVYADVRRVPISSQTLADLIPSSNVWAGPTEAKHLAGPPLIFASTSEGSTPFRLSLHVDDIGHTMIIGPTGAGKSVLLSTIILQFLRYKNARIFIFDKGRSSRATVLGVGGNFHDLTDADAIAFQPLRDLHKKATFDWALEWVENILLRADVALTPEIKILVREALTTIIELPQEQRTMTALFNQIQHFESRAALEAYTVGGKYGRFLEASENKLELSNVQAFEMDDLLATKDLAMVILSYLFHQIQQSLDGSPTIIILDEAWQLLDDEYFSTQLREWLKTLRKLNASVIFATQSLADIAGSTITSALIESCPTRILLPNARAKDPAMAGTYRDFGLRVPEIDLIANSKPKMDYFISSPQGTRRFQLNLDELTLAFVAAGSLEDQKLLDSIQLESKTRPHPLAVSFLQAKGMLDDANELIERGRMHNA